jgi:hypothetical protein
MRLLDTPSVSSAEAGVATTAAAAAAVKTRKRGRFA